MFLFFLSFILLKFNTFNYPSKQRTTVDIFDDNVLTFFKETIKGNFVYFWGRQWISFLNMCLWLSQEAAKYPQKQRVARVLMLHQFPYFLRTWLIKHLGQYSNQPHGQNPTFTFCFLLINETIPFRQTCIFCWILLL